MKKEASVRKIVLGLAVVIAGACTSGSSKAPMFVIAGPTGSSLQAQYVACVAYYRAQGLSTKQASDECQPSDAALTLAVLRGGAIAQPPEILGINKGTRVAVPSCPKVSGDLRVAEVAGGGDPAADPEPEDPSDEPYVPDMSLEEAKDALDEAKVDYAEALEASRQVEHDCKAGKASACLADIYLHEAMDEAIARAQHAGAAIEHYTGKNPATIKSTINHPSPDAQSACSDVQSFVMSCNAMNWRGDECQQFLSRLNKCADPKLARTDPDSTANCGTPAISGEQAAAVVVLACSQKKRFVPGENPCEPLRLTGTLTRYRLPGMNWKPGEVPPWCNDPQARHTGDGCFPEVDITRLPLPDLQKEMRRIEQKLGGPGVVLIRTTPTPIPQQGTDPFPKK